VTGENRELNVSLGNGGAGDNIYENKGLSSYNIQGLSFDEIYHKTLGDKITDICKMDIEGAEFEVFQKKHFECLKKCRYLLIEIHHEENRARKEVLQKLREINFKEIDGESKNDDSHYVHFFINEGLSHKSNN
jgi:hypothetical protein